jgi:hypothetical protein
MLLLHANSSGPGCLRALGTSQTPITGIDGINRGERKEEGS